MFFLFDIGGTKIRAGVSRNLETIENIKIFDTPTAFKDVLSLFKKEVPALTGGAKVEGIVGGIAGIFDKEKSALLNISNLPQEWIGEPIKNELLNFFGTPVLLENDSALAALGEAVYGAGKDKRIVAYITIGTGVGGARIVDGKIDENIMGFEPGHQIICMESEFFCSSCRTPGHLEAYVSGTAVERRYHRKPAEIDSPEILDNLASHLAYGLNNTIVHWSPDILILGGSMITGKAPIPIEKIRFYLDKTMTIFTKVPPVEVSLLGDTVVLYGAQALAKQYFSVTQ